MLRFAAGTLAWGVAMFTGGAVGAVGAWAVTAGALILVAAAIVAAMAMDSGPASPQEG